MTADRVDYSLYLVTDRELSRKRTTFEIVEKAVRGGVTVVQLREKNCPTKAFVRQALEIKEFLKDKNVPLIINDRVDVAMAVEADGVHLGQDDMPLKMARKLLKKSTLIGVSAHTRKEAAAAEKDGADYLGVGPVYSTATKTDTAPVCGPEGLRAIKNCVDIPVVGIGGIGKENAFQVISKGADGIAVVSAIVAAEDPEKESVTLRTMIDKARDL